MGGRDHSCEVCGRGGFNDPDGECECPPVGGQELVEDLLSLLAGVVAERDRLAEALKEAWDFLGRDRYYAPPELEKKVREALASLGRGNDG